MTKPTIYEQHDAAFKNVQAYVILKDGERVATIAFKFPTDGTGRLYAYVHWFGAGMVRGFANGYGYDKKSASVENAVSIMGKALVPSATDFYLALKNIGGNNWDNALRESGFTVLQAV